MGEKRFCVTCNKDVEIDTVIPHEDYDEQILSCGHTGRRINRSIEETISISKKVADSKTITIESIGNAPIKVSGDAGVQGYGLLTSLTINNLNGNLILDRNSIANLLSTYQIDSSSSVDNSTNIDMHDIFIDINKSDNSPEQKEMIREILNTINKDIKTKPLPLILTSLGTNLKTCLPLATPFIIPFLTKLISPS
jgi:hypothetical protein